MKKAPLSLTFKRIGFVTIVMLLQACATAVPKNTVMAAYETSGVVTIKPYTRTIFSPSNF